MSEKYNFVHENEYEIKPEVLESKEKFEYQANYYLTKFEEFKKLEKTMKQYEHNIRAYMIDKNIETYTDDVGLIDACPSMSYVTEGVNGPEEHHTSRGEFLIVAMKKKPNSRKRNKTQSATARRATNN